MICQIHENGRFETKLKKRVFTALSEGGTEFIKEHKIIEGLKALEDFKKILASYNNPEMSVVGTAILRKAINRQSFIKQAEEILNTKINIIDGLVEADYIYKGMILHKYLQIDKHLIMDIGGGSTEFILIDQGLKLWSQSFPIGVGMLYEKFHKTEPISISDLNNLSHFIHTEVKELTDIVNQHDSLTLAGASGSFEVLQHIAHGKVEDNEISIIQNETFLTIYEKIIVSDESERKILPGLPHERVKLIVVGMILKKVIFDIVKPSKIIVSPYALKEGVIQEMIEKRK